ncbi:MAG: hypothetical protein RSA27_08685, partial [Oscillospiraceae bacterium]
MKKTYKRYTKTKKIVAVALVFAMMLTCLPNVLAVTMKTDKVDSGDKILDGSSDINVLNPNATAVPILEPTVAPTMVPTPSEDEGLALPLPTPISTITTEDVSDETLVSSEKPTLYAKGLETTPDGKPTKDENGYITSTYGYPLKGDPYDKTKTVLSKTSGNYTLQDEKFFGKWNSKAEKWEIVGKFNYDEFPGLSDVQTAVKSGDYEEAKLALYLYYRDKERNGTRPKDTSISTKDRITADLLTENYMYNANSGMEPVTMLTFDGTPKYAGGDVTDILIKKMGARQEITVIVTATNKDGGVIKFNSREGGKDVSPFLKVKVNGTEMNIYPSADT